MKYFELLLLTGAMITFNSCCQMKECYSVEDINVIEFSHFKESELDSILMVTYEKNSDFCSSIDTFLMVEFEYNEADSTGVAFMKERLNPNLDYKVIMPHNNFSYELTDFVLKKIECNYCFPTGYTHVVILESYLINGRKKINGGLSLQITR